MISLPDLKDKIIWDLSIEEIEYVYSNLHMNNYVYVVAMNYHKSKYPTELKINIKDDSIPDFLKFYTFKLFELIPYLNHYNPKIVLAQYLYRSYFLFEKLRYLRIEQLQDVVDLFSALAFIPIIAEKNLDILVWPHLIVRPVNEKILNTFHLLQEDFDIYDIIPEYKEKKELKNDLLILKFIHTSVTTLLTLAENDFDKRKIAETFLKVENKLFELEKRYGFVKVDNLKENFVIGTQLRWRTTLYLYGGRIFENMKEYQQAYSWYTKGIYTIKLYEHFPYYLTDFKITERLLCAYRTGEKLGKDTILLRDLINYCMLRGLQDTAEYSNQILNFIKSNPLVELNGKNLSNDKVNLQYSGESVREIYFICLFYNYIIKKIRFEDIDYSRYLKT
ncbi:MAG: hypothetical protein ACFFDY_07400 [Candidatus Thorarchaeota archaeon]